MTIKQLFDDMWEYNNIHDEFTFPMGIKDFYIYIWNDWRKDNKIKLVDALALWDYMIKTELVDENYSYDDGEDFEIHVLDVKNIIEQIRLLKIECDFN